MDVSCIVIPSIDISEGKAVKRVQGVPGTEIVKIDPHTVVSEIIKFREYVKRVHIVDLDGARLGKPVNYETILKLIRIFREYGIQVQIGGGIRSVEHADLYLRFDNVNIVVSSIVFLDKAKFRQMADKFDIDRIFVSIDIRQGKIAISGWSTQIDVDPIEILVELNVRNLIYTCIDVEGLMRGPKPDTMLISKLRSRLNVRNFFYAGGVRNCEDVKMLCGLGFNGVIIGRAMYMLGLEHFCRCLE